MVAVCPPLICPTVTSPNARFDDDALSAPGPWPIPLSCTFTGARPTDVPEMVSVPVRVPVPVGVNVTCAPQLLPEASVVPQVLCASAKSPEILRREFGHAAAS